jgi:hypothetical protein
MLQGLLSHTKRLTPAIAILACLHGAARAADVTTYHYDMARTGLNDAESKLTQGAVASAKFQTLRTVTLNTLMDAQPLVISAETMASWGYKKIFPHDTVYLADEANTVFAVDSKTGAVLLQKNFGTPVAMQNLPGQCNNNAGTVGINSTPVIDTANRVMYFITYTWENNAPVYRIHEMNLVDLSEKVPSVVISATGTLSDGTSSAFAPGSQRQRTALLLANGNVYAGFGTFCDANDNIVRGWLMGWQTGTLTPLDAELTQQQTALQSTNNPFGGNPPFYLSGVWMSGYGPSADGAGNVYFVTGNSDGIIANNLPDSLVRMSPDLSTVEDYFTPADFAALDAQDEDRGSGGVMVVPDQANGTQFAVSQGKDGRLFLHNRAANLGGFVPGGPDVPGYVAGGPCWCGPAYYVGSDGNPRVLANGGTEAETWTLPSTAAGSLQFDAIGPSLPSLDGDDPGFMSSVSSNGTAPFSEVIWSVTRSNNGTVFLEALSGTPVPEHNTSVRDVYGNSWSFSTQASQGNSWALLNGGPGQGANGVEIVIDNQGRAWIQNAQQAWYSNNGSAWSGPGGPPLVTTPAAVAITPAVPASITDASSNVWSFGTQVASGGTQILINGAPAFGGYAVKLENDTQGVLWQQNADGYWWYSTGSGWTSSATGPNFTVPSKPGTIVTPTTGGVLADNAGHVFSLGPQPAKSGNEILLNGESARHGGAVKLVIDNAGVLWANTAENGWWAYENGVWAEQTGGPSLPAWSAGAMITSGRGTLPSLQLVPAGNWGIFNANDNLMPVVANGKVYVASNGELRIWGIEK